MLGSLRRLASPASAQGARALSSSGAIGGLAGQEKKTKRRWSDPWTYQKYLRHKPADASYNDTDSDGWTITASMAIERSPRLQQFDPSWYVEWKVFQDTLDLDRKKVVPLDWVQTTKQATEDKERTFHPNPRVTDEDRANERQSLHRSLDTSTFLLVKVDGQWQFPQGTWQNDQTIRETAEKSAREIYGSELEVYLLGNAPVAHLEDSEKKTKWFLMHNLYVGGNVKLENEHVEDFAWVNKNEFKEYFDDPKLLDLLNKVFYTP